MAGAAAILVLAVFLSTFLAAQLSSGAPPPIVIVPGILGSQMEAKLDKTGGPTFCEKHHDWYTMWLDITSLTPFFEECFADNAQLHYDSTTGKYSNTPGVETRMPGFGNTNGIEYLDPYAKWLEEAVYFHPMVEYFVSKHGYIRGKTIVSAPYDWRYAADGFAEQGYYANLMKLIETTYFAGGNEPVALIAHSMGGPTSLYFLTKYVNQAWKDKYIRYYITLSAVWQGAARAIRGMVSGTNEGIIIARDIWGRASQRSYPSTAWLFPYPSTDVWPSDQVIFITPEANYTAWDYKALFTRLKYMRGYDMFETVCNLTGSIPPPNVTTFCYHGEGVPTNVQFVYSEGEFPDTQPKEITGDGDGTVNIKSLKACTRWQTQQSRKVSVMGFKGVEHVHMVKNQNVIDAVETILMSNS